MKQQMMKCAAFCATLLFTITLSAQTSRVSEPQYIAIDSKDNVFVAIKYGIIKITPDGTLTNLTKQASIIGDLDRTWKNLIVDSKDNLYANDDKVIYKFTFTSDRKFVGKLFTG